MVKRAACIVKKLAKEIGVLASPTTIVEACSIVRRDVVVYANTS
jgi:hypothetical protein